MSRTQIDDLADVIGHHLPADASERFRETFHGLRGADHRSAWAAWLVWLFESGDVMFPHYAGEPAEQRPMMESVLGMLRRVVAGARVEAADWRAGGLGAWTAPATPAGVANGWREAPWGIEAARAAAGSMLPGHERAAIDVACAAGMASGWETAWPMMAEALLRILRSQPEQ